MSNTQTGNQQGATFTNICHTSCKFGEYLERLIAAPVHFVPKRHATLAATAGFTAELFPAPQHMTSVLDP